MSRRCKICRDPKAGPGLIEGALKGWTPHDAYRYGEQFGLTFSEPSWYGHKAHVRADAEAAALEPDEPVELAPVVTNQQVLEAIRNRAFADMAGGKTTMLKEGLRAVQLLMAQKTEADGKSFLSMLTTGHSPRIQVIDDLPDED